MISFVPRHRILALVGAASLTLAGCGVSMSGDGGEPLATISIDSKQAAEIAKSDVAGVLEDIASSDRFMQAFFSEGMTAVAERGVATEMIVAAVMSAEATKLGVTPDVAAISEQLELRLAEVAATVDPGDPTVAASEIRSELGRYFDLAAENIANENAIRERYASDAASEGGDGVPCVSHILVGPEDEVLANDLLAQLSDGADFAALAQANSIDPGSGAAGGELGCVDPQNWVPAFRDAVILADLDELVGPVETEFGYHIIKVTGFDYTAVAEQRFAAIFDNVEVDIDPAFGTWDTTNRIVVDTVVVDTVVDDADAP